jgi:hypothetical protein
MVYLNVSPMISVLQHHPDTFAFESGELYHMPSRHRFLFDSQRQMTVDANCGCSCLRVSAEQAGALYEAFQQRRTNCWHAIEINRKFAAHFAPPSLLRSQLIRFTGWLHQSAMTSSQPSKAEILRSRSCGTVTLTWM